MSAREPTAGHMDGKIFLFPVRVYYEDTDFSGVVYHANYLRFMERSRSEFLRSIGLRHQGMLTAAEPLVWAVRRIVVDFTAPARVDETLIVATRVAAIAGARMTLEQEVRREEKALITAEVDVCVVTLMGKARRIPENMRRTLETYVS